MQFSKAEESYRGWILPLTNLKGIACCLSNIRSIIPMKASIQAWTVICSLPNMIAIRLGIPREHILLKFKSDSPSGTCTADHVKIVARLRITNIGKKSFQNIKRSQPSNTTTDKTEEAKRTHRRFRRININLFHGCEM
jgi:hypothetical protein